MSDKLKQRELREESLPIYRGLSPSGALIASDNCVCITEESLSPDGELGKIDRTTLDINFPSVYTTDMNRVLTFAPKETK